MHFDTKNTDPKAIRTGANSLEKRNLDDLTSFAGNLFQLSNGIALDENTTVKYINLVVPFGKKVIIFNQQLSVRGIGRIVRTITVRDSGIDIDAAKALIYGRNLEVSFDWLGEGLDADNTKKLVLPDGSNRIDGVFVNEDGGADDGENIAAVLAAIVGVEGANPIQSSTGSLVEFFELPFVTIGEPAVIGSGDRMGTIYTIKLELFAIAGGVPATINEVSGILRSVFAVFDDETFIEDPENLGTYIYNPAGDRARTIKSGLYR